MAEMNKKIELKPCPFCGGKVKAYLKNVGIFILFFKCRECGAVISFDNEKYNKAVKHYNTRAKGKVKN